MTTIQEPAQVDMDKLMAFVFRAVDEVGATLNAALVVMGDKLGYYRDLAAHGPSTPSRTRRAHRHEPSPTPASGSTPRQPGRTSPTTRATGTYTLPPEQVVALTVEDSPAFLPGFFQIALGTVHDTSKILEAAKSGAGYGWHEHDTDVHVGCERFFRPSYHAHLVAEWLPALDGMVDKLTAGTTVADVGCGHGASTILMAQAFPASTFVGSDYHPESIEIARARAAEAGVLGPRAASRSRPPTASAAPASAWSRCSTACTTWATRSAQPGTSAARWPTTAPGWSSSRWPATTSRTTSTRSAAPTTASRRSCARRRRCRRTSASRSARRPARRRSATSPRPAASPGSAGWPQTPFNQVFEVRP